MDRKSSNLIIRSAAEYFQADPCICSAEAKKFHTNPYWYASAYCPRHRDLFVFRWLDKAKRLPDQFEHRYHFVGNFEWLFDKEIVRRTIAEWQRLTDIPSKSVLFFGRLHWADQTGLHVHFAVASCYKLSEAALRGNWVLAHERKAGTTTTLPPSCELQRHPWATNCRYILQGWGDDGAPQLPPYGKYKRLVRCSKTFMPTKKAKS